MPINKLSQEIAPVLAVNSTTLGISLTDCEIALKILLLLFSLAYTADKWISHRKRMSKKK